MSFKVYLPDNLSAVEWSQAVWKLDAGTVASEDCRSQLIHDVILQHLPKDGLVVDAGCGIASWPTYLRQRGYRVMGLECSTEACGIARESDRGLDLIQCDVRRTPLRSESVDAILSLGVVEHAEEGPHEALREAHRVLKPGGTMILAVPFDNPLRRIVVNRLLSYVTRKRRSAGWSLGFAEYRFSSSEVTAFVEETGFEIVGRHPNDLRPPRNMGLWVDHDLLLWNPLQPAKEEELFILPGIKGRIATILTSWMPWLVCGEIAVVARKPGTTAPRA